MAQPSSTAGGATEEVGSLDRLLTRLALTEEDRLERVLSKLLPHAILQLSSPHEATKKKVLEMLTHINKRVRDQHHIQLPTPELLDLYRRPGAAPMVRNFAIVYLEMAWGRSPPEKKLELAPGVLEGIANRQPQHQEMLLRMAAGALDCYGSQRGTRDEEQVEERFSFLRDDGDLSTFLEFALHTLLYQAPGVGENGAQMAPPGLSLQQANRVAGKVVLSGDALAVRKLGILNFLGATSLPPKTLYPLLLVASADRQDPVSKRGEELFKKKAATADLEDKELLAKLFSIMPGSSTASPSPAVAPPPDQQVCPPSLPLQLKLMSAYVRSVAAANSYPASVDLLFVCLYAAGTTMRLMQGGMEFVIWIFKHSSDEHLEPMKAFIHRGLTKLLFKGEGAGPTDAGDPQLRSFAYQALGQLAQRAPELFSGSVVPARRLFGALVTEGQGVRSAVQGAVAALAGAYEKSDRAILSELESLLLESIRSPDDAVRFAAVQWGTRLFPGSHAVGRYISMLGAGDTKLGIRELADRSLQPTADTSTTPTAGPVEQLPSLAGVMAVVAIQTPQVLRSLELRKGGGLLFEPKAYIAMIKFIRRCRNQPTEGSSGDAAMSEEQTPAVLAGVGADGCYELLLLHAMVKEGTSELHLTATAALLEVASGSPDTFAIRFAPRLPWLLQHLGHVDAAVRDTVAKLVGIVVAAVPAGQVAEMVADLCGRFDVGAKGRYEDTQGAIAAVGYIGAQCMTGKPKLEPDQLQAAAANLCRALRNPTAGISAAAAEALGHVGLRGSLPLPEGEVADTLAWDVKGKAPAAATAAATVATPAAASSSAGAGAAPGASDAVSEQGDAAAAATAGNGGSGAVGAADENVSTRAVVVARLLSMLRDKDVKSVQSAAKALGYLCHGNRSPVLAEQAVTGLVALFGSTHEDTLFSLGEALAFVWGDVAVTADTVLRTDFVSLAATARLLGAASDPAEELSSGADVKMEIAAPPPDADAHKVQETITRRLFNDFLFSSRRNERCAGSVVLLSLVSFCGRSPRLRAMLPDIQEAFSTLLGDQMELTQEMASRGMSIVYQLGDKDTKEALVAALVGTLSGTTKRRRLVKVTAESEVFQEGSLGEAPGGGSINTYKELCAIANEMGQPDLIYKFMDLANYQAGLASRRGAAFGFAGIAKKAGEALAPHMPVLVPKLYRMQFDPNQGIRDAMGHIWRSVVPDTRRATDQHFASIMDDLLANIGSRMWRSREAACLALADLLQGRRWPEVATYLERMWQMAIRALDDIKETVRVAATTLCRTLGSLSTRLCDPSLTPVGESKEAMAIILPFLLHSGISSSVAEVRRLSLNTIAKLVKQATPAVLRPQIPDLVTTMLEGLSNLEDSRLNYLQLHAERLDTGAADKLESARVAATHDSPLWETLDYCLRQLDGPTLESLAPKLTQLVRSGVGLNTRAGTARFISLVAQRVSPDVVRPVSASLLKALLPTVRSEKSAAARRAFASSTAAIARLAGPTQQSKLLRQTAELYGEDAGPEGRVACALLLRELSRQASDLVKTYQVDVLPLSFIGKYDVDKDVSSMFAEVWEENSATASAAVRLFMAEIVARILSGLQSSSWPRKHQSAKALAALADTVGDMAAMAPFTPGLLQALLAELPGRLWEGKEAVLDALGRLCKATHNTIESSKEGAETPEAIVQAVVAACRRKKKAYKEAALKCLQTVLKAFKSRDVYNLVAPLLVEACKAPPRPPRPTGDAAVAAEMADEPEDVTLPLGHALQCLSATFDGAAASTVEERAGEVSEAIAAALATDRPWDARAAALTAAKAYVTKLAATPGGAAASDPPSLGRPQLERVQPLIEQAVRCLDDQKYSQVRVAALAFIAETLGLSQNGAALDAGTRRTVESRLRSIAQEDKNAGVRSQALRMLEEVEVKQQGSSIAMVE